MVPNWIRVAVFWVTQISWIFVRTSGLGFGLILVISKLATDGARYYFLTQKFFFVDFIEMIITIFILSLELTSYHQVSNLK